MKELHFTYISSFIYQVIRKPLKFLDMNVRFLCAYILVDLSTWSADQICNEIWKMQKAKAKYIMGNFMT